jgi:acetyl-CoA carboxylase beta subunit
VDFVLHWYSVSSRMDNLVNTKESKMLGLKLDPKCPRCGGVMYCETDTYEEYLTCTHCAREFNINMSERRMSTKQFRKRFGINLPNIVESVII